jgi:hypothetical protein
LRRDRNAMAAARRAAAVSASVPEVVIEVADLRFRARLETERAPLTCAALLKLLPLREELLQARWSGQSAWIPLGDLSVDVPPENATSYPAPGELLLYPGGVSETELLLPYGPTHFASKAGTLAGNHCLTIVDGAAQLPELGRRVLWEGAQPITISTT